MSAVSVVRPIALAFTPQYSILCITSEVIYHATNRVALAVYVTTCVLAAATLDATVMYGIAHGDSCKQYHLQSSLQMKAMLIQTAYRTDVYSVGYQAYQGKRRKLALLCLASNTTLL